jgi:MFS transporter, putative metabolite:H+ symporter
VTYKSDAGRGALPVGNRYAALIAVSLPSFVYGLFRFSIGIVVPRIEAAYAISDSVMGTIVSVSVGVVGLGVFASGTLAERYGGRNTIVIGLLLFSLPLALLVTGLGLVAFSAAFVLASFGAGLVIPTSYAVVSEILPLRRGIGAGLVTSAYNVGGLVGPAVVGFLLLYYAWNDAFLLIPLAGIASVVIFYASIPASVGRAPAGPRGQYRRLLDNRSVLLLAIAGFLGDAAFLSYLSWTPKFILTSYDVSGSTAALVDLSFGVGTGLGAIGIFVAGFLHDRVGGRVGAIVGGTATVLATGGIYLSSSLLEAVALVVAGSFFLNWFWALLTLMSQSAVPRESRASAVSLVQTAAFVGAFVGPGLVGLIGGAHAAQLLLAVTLPNALFVLVMVLLYRDRPFQD